MSISANVFKATVTMTRHNGETQPLRLNELGMDREEIERKETSRRLLFTFLIVSFCLIVAAFAYTLKIDHIHMQQAEGDSNFIPTEKNSNNKAGN